MLSSNRATVHVVGVVMLLAVTLVLAAAVGGAVLSHDPPDAPDLVVLTLDVDGDRVALTHDRGAPLDVRRIDVSVAVDGTPLAHQPPVPFFAAAGFAPGPTGPFNRATDSRWTAGETGAFRVAGTNRPSIDAGSTVSVTISDDDGVVARLSARAS